MMKRDDVVMIRAIAICFKPFLKPEEALIYCNLSRTQFALKCEEFGILKTGGGYYKKEDLDLICTGGSSLSQLKVNEVITAVKNRKGF
ncbi:hypothetical protein I5907_19470 [Panacibacter sp. DH6]|uniref:Uncharacterized protein n=1 Tax=Panacibacter microcysteis TaxID=2793269 RepID=A0A931MD17_9BACT|nr:hypothetical protein [Panacibacter microcysteis]MBG9378426.1 hypothetical protein [Panacibacter microcysteis]